MDLKKVCRCAIFSFMAEPRNKLVDQLVTLLRRAIGVAEQLKGDAPKEDATIAAEVAEKISKRICLACGATIPESKQYRRGLDAKHYQKAMRNIDRGQYTEAALMAKGLLGPRGVGGPRTESSLLDDPKIASLLTRAVAENPPTKADTAAGKEAAQSMGQKAKAIKPRKKSEK
jgi:hypothetical protein